MKLAWILWLASLMSPQAADSLCLSTTLYLEARNQPLLGQQAVDGGGDVGSAVDQRAVQVEQDG